MKQILLLLFCGLLLMNQALALSSDKRQMAHFIADTVYYNHQTHIEIFKGHVTMQQGTTHLDADQVITYKNKAGAIYKIVATGNLAHYQTLPDKKKKVVNAYAKTIEYYPNQSLAILIGNAKLTQAGNVFNGPRITYNMAKQIIESAPAKGMRSFITIQPQVKDPKS